MPTVSALGSLGSAAVLMSALLIAAPEPAQALICNTSRLIGQAYAPSSALGLAKARLNWVAKVKDYYGLPYTNWHLAAERDEFCLEESGNQLLCRAIGRACRPDQRDPGPRDRTN